MAGRQHKKTVIDEDANRESFPLLLEQGTHFPRKSPGKRSLPFSQEKCGDVCFIYIDNEKITKHLEWINND